MKPIDILGMGPTRTITALADGRFEVKVQPPAWVGKYPAKVVTLTEDQYRRYKLWEGGTLIQDALPDLTGVEREIILNGDPT